MSNSEKLNNCKIEIRSVLLPLQRGCSLVEFQREYKKFIGTRLPSSNFGYKTDIDFLYSMPDVVRITPFRNGDYHLQAVADENSKHIQKMVAKQKPSKLKGPPPPRYNRPPRTFVLPPRFMSEIKSTPEPKLRQKTITKETIIPPTESVSTRTESAPKLSPKDEVVILVQKHHDKLALDDLLVEYQRMYNKHLSLSTYGLSSIQECIECIPELKIIRKNSVDFIVPNNRVENSYEEVSDFNTDRIPTPEAPSMNSNSSRTQSYYEGNVPNSLRRKFQEVADRHPDGIWASDFPDYFQEVTSDSLDFIGLGYRCLADIIDDVPDIFIRKTVAGSRKDYIIYPAKSDVDGSMFVDHIILNFRKILEGYPEGIKIKDILHVYSINCKDTLHIEDLGFDNLETFLASIKNSIPLRFGFIDGEKSVHLKHSSTTEELSKAPEYKYETWIPSDAIVPDFVKIKPLTLPADFDFSEYVPVYVSAVAHPGHLYVQFEPDDSEHGFKKLSEEIESFYNGILSETYMMKDMHVKEGAFCIAKWPADNHWYRSQILSVPSASTVKVLYIDYGTSDTISMHLLRYVKKEFTVLPVQALRCRLAYIKPPHNQEKWGMEVRNRILSLCMDIPLMAKFEKGPGGVYSVILCDTNGKEDVYINDVLCNEGLAELSCNENVSVSPELKTPLEYHHSLNPLQALQAQYFLKAFVTVAPSFAQNEHYLTLLQQVSMYCQTNDIINQSPGIPLMAPIGPPGFNPVPQNLKPYSQINSNMMGPTYPGIAALEGNLIRSRINATVGANPADYAIKAPVERDTYTFSKPIENASLGNGEEENEIFDEDDDELFQQFCQKATSSNVRYVKRVILGDGYKIHIVVVNSIAYASSGDISQLIWNNKEADYLFRNLEREEVDIPVVTLSEDGNEELFQQLDRLNVKGVQNITGFKSSITLFPLKSVIKILNVFGHPSIKLRKRIREEIANFNPNDPFWQDFSPDVVESEDEDNNASETDDAKIEKLCLYDLKAMKESIRCKKMKILNNQNNNHSDEIHKLENLHRRVLQRIELVEEICKKFEIYNIA